MTLPGVMVALAILVDCKQLEAYTLNYFDCRDMDKLKTYHVSKACSLRTLDRTKTVEYTLLQKRRVLNMKGFFVSHPDRILRRL